ncbi:MAG: tyrosine--tRNA ligase [Planctomycetaceae bacterium]|nr:tyrosine--tRNA ligase [Planctomycetaceae bacterium]
MNAFLEDLRWRGLLHQTTSDDLGAHLDGGCRSAYVGYDPTADSLTIGNLVSIILLGRLQRAGHRPVALMGGGTGMIGDPSGKSAERPLLTPDQVEANVQSIRPIFERILDFSGNADNSAELVDNIDWLGRIGYIELLRDIGKHFSVNVMMQKESVSARLNEREQGISYTEFSYQVLQAYDFLHLFRTRGVTLQMGGSDQYGNIVAGIDLVRRLERVDDGADGTTGAETFGLTTPLVTKADGGKFGKSESGAIWLTAARTSPYRFHQFWLNSSDADVVNYLRWFTFLEREEIEGLATATQERPQERAAQKRLADEVTAMLHGVGEVEAARKAAEALFSGEVRGLGAVSLAAIAEDIGVVERPREELSSAEPPTIGLLLKDLGLASSNREVREFIGGGAVRVNGDQVSEDRALVTDDLLEGGFTLLRRGRKNWAAIRWT